MLSQTNPFSSPASSVAKPSLVGLTRTGLSEALAAIGIPDRQINMRAGQLWHWIYLRGATDFNEMTNVSKDLRSVLAEHYTLSRPQIVTEQVSEDGTRKWLLRFPPRGAGRPVEIETVYIPEEGRGTLCLSSQVGCTLSCSFCHTGTQKLVRNLTAEEIVGQILLARDRLGDYPDHAPASGDAAVPSTGRLVSNVVMYFIILTTGATLHLHGHTDVQTAAEAAKALEPVAGKAAALAPCGASSGSAPAAEPRQFMQ